MIPYILLGAIGGFVIGAGITYDLFKQEIKTGVVAIGRRVYRVVHSTDLREKK
ncbi:TPA: hypothetical protein ACTYZB_004890 [Klebsiella variicola]